MLSAAASMERPRRVPAQILNGLEIVGGIVIQLISPLKVIIFGLLASVAVASSVFDGWGPHAHDTDSV